MMQGYWVVLIYKIPCNSIINDNEKRSGNRRYNEVGAGVRVCAQIRKSG